MAFVAYLRLKGRRSHRPVAAQTGRSFRAIRRLSAQFNWPGRVAAFEARLADASQNAVDLLVRATSTHTAADFERLRAAEFQLAQRVLQESARWLKLASDPRRRDVSLGQVCRVIDLATKLGRLAAGLPTGDEPRRRPRPEDVSGYWTGPSAEEALEKIYGSPSSADSPPPDTVDRHPVQTPTANPPSAAGNLNSDPCDLGSANSNLPPATAGAAPVAASPGRRRDAWSAWARSQCRAVTGRHT
jgi:hypothetical protein